MAPSLLIPVDFSKMSEKHQELIDLSTWILIKYKPSVLKQAVDLEYTKFFADFFDIP
jgi:hypothetical protein